MTKSQSLWRSVWLVGFEPTTIFWVIEELYPLSYSHTRAQLKRSSEFVYRRPKSLWIKIQVKTKLLNRRYDWISSESKKRRRRPAGHTAGLFLSTWRERPLRRSQRWSQSALRDIRRSRHSGRQPPTQVIMQLGSKKKKYPLTLNWKGKRTTLW